MSYTSTKVEIKAYGGANYTDITSYIKEKGITWSFNSVDADGAGRSLDGTMHRKQIAIKNKLEIQCRPLTTSEMDALTTLLANEWLSCKITDASGSTEFKCYRGATVSTGILVSYTTTRELWGNFKFSLIEE